jgi:neutral ceramidase
VNARLPTLAAVALSWACAAEDDVAWPPIRPGAPYAGVSVVDLPLPIDAPLAGDPERAIEADGVRALPRALGSHSTPRIRALWLDNGDDHLALVKVDLPHAASGLAATADAALAAQGYATGRVVVVASGTTSGHGGLADGSRFAPWTGAFDREAHLRAAGAIATAVLAARDAREPVSIGLAEVRGWDEDGALSTDTRPDNDDLPIWTGVPTWSRQDDTLQVLRVDRAEGGPLAAVVWLGLSASAFGGADGLTSTDVSGAMERAMEEVLGEGAIAMHLQNASAGSGPLPRWPGAPGVEQLGADVAQAALATWESVPTRPDPIRLEVFSRHAWQSPEDTHVARRGAVDWRYDPEQPAPDGVIFDATGRLRSPLDEFAAAGGALCGSASLGVAAATLPIANVPPYDDCFSLDEALAAWGVQPPDTPPGELLKAGVAALRMGPLPVLSEDQAVAVEEVVVGFLPGAVSGPVDEQWRRNLNALGFRHAPLVGHAVDHEGPLLLPEDWLQGGQALTGGAWGPLQGEHLLEQLVAGVEEVLLDARLEDPDPWGYFLPPPLPGAVALDPPRTSPETGTPLSAVPTELRLPEGVASTVASGSLPRVQGILQIAWLGGDPRVDAPVVSVERHDGAVWVPLRDRASRPIDTRTGQVLMTYARLEDGRHGWWAGWQIVGGPDDRRALALAEYRLRVNGSTWAGGSEWPFLTSPYVTFSAVTDVLPAELDVDLVDDLLYVALAAPPGGWRVLNPDLGARGPFPTDGPVSFAATTASGEQVTGSASPLFEQDGYTVFAPSIPPDAVQIDVTDADGNAGSWTIDDAVK